MGNSQVIEDPVSGFRGRHGGMCPSCSGSVLLLFLRVNSGDGRLSEQSTLFKVFICYLSLIV